GSFIDTPIAVNGVRAYSTSVEKSVTFQNGQILSGRFRIVRLLGVGGMGEVYEAEDLVLHKPTALKTIRSHIAADERMRARLAQEVHAAQEIAHPNICRINDLHFDRPAGGRDEEIAYLTMELLEGETLSAHLRRAGAMSASGAEPLAKQLASALSAAHRAGVIHRDFKSANVILATSPGGNTRAVVTDFGLAQSVRTHPASEHLTGTGQIVGTPAYMAPEQLFGGPITSAVDIYALGVVLYEM